jgi:cytochrome c553
MLSHFNSVVEIRDALVSGDVGATRSPARWLASHQFEPEEYSMQEAREALEQMRAESRMILTQKGIPEMARSVGRLGAACGSCHTAMKQGPRLSVPSAPPSPAAGATPEAHMNRHAWASERLWEGLVAPSDASWMVGAAVLTGPALDWGPAGSASPRVLELQAKVTQLAQDARQTESLQDRATLYGQLLETCADCHEIVGMGMSR